MARKITFRFIGYFFFFYALLFLMSIAVLVYTFFEIVTAFPYSDIRETELSTIQSSVDMQKNGDYFIEESLVKAAHKSGGYLLVMNHDGEVLSSTIHPSFVQASYSFQQMMKLVDDKHYYLWPLDSNASLLFVEQSVSDNFLQQLMENPSFPVMNENGKELVTSNEAWFVQFNESGEIVEQIGTPSIETNQLSLFHTQQHLTEQKVAVSIEPLPDGTTVAVGVKNPNYFPESEEFNAFFIRLLVGFIVFNISMLLLILVISLWIGRRFGKPLFYMLKWIEQLSKGNYERPTDWKVQDKKSGQFKRKYRFYHDVEKSLTSLTTTLKENKRFAERMEQLREDWITGLSHDLRTPLSSIFGYASMLDSKYEWSLEEVRNFGRTIQQKADYMDKLIQDLTLTYQLKNNAIELNFENVYLSKYTKNYLEENDWPLEYVNDLSGSATVLLDVDRFGRVLDNIIANAMKYNPEGTPITVKLHQEKETVVIQVIDQGQGIPKEVMENLFTRYYRGTNTTDGDSGTGLGLSIAKQLVEAHEGEIDVHSSRTGTTIFIRLPLNSIEFISKSEV